jgi:hypothetical protein
MTGLNIKLQGENHNVNEMFDKITVFKRKVQLWDLKMWPKQCATPPSTEDGNAFRFSEIHGRNSASSTRIKLIF